MAPSERNLVSIEIIKKAVDGNSSAVAQILDHYDAYVTWFASSAECDRNGSVQYVLDEDVKADIQEALIEAIPKFKLQEILDGKYKGTEKNRKR
jgi:hypothetical protein